MALILLVLGCLGIGVVAVAWWALPEVLGGEQVELRPAKATVIESASCGSSAGGDLVQVRIGGQERRARFDGCGHLPGQELSVLVPVDPGEEFVVRPPAEEGAGARERLTRVLLVLAGVAGGGYALLLRSGRARTPAVE